MDWCRDLLAGRIECADPDTPSLRWIGGPPAGPDAERGGWSGTVAYWPRVWAARALRYVWDPAAAADVLAGLRDSSWRVREHCAALVGRYEIAAAAEALCWLADADTEDTVRVRIAAVRALAEVAESEQVERLSTALHDPDPRVRSAAEQALRRTAARLDRPLP